MELRIKEKTIDGKKVKGIINQNLKTIAPFEFENITLFEHRNGDYYICTKEDGTASIYDSRGVLRVDCKDGYKNLQILTRDLGYHIYVIATYGDKVGIICSTDANYGYSNKEPKITLTTSYEFGQCDEIIQLSNGSVQLIKHAKSGDRIGYWFNADTFERVKPIYTSYDYFKAKSIKGLGLYKYKDGNGNQTVGYYQLSDTPWKDKLCTKIGTIIYSSFKGKKKLYGVKHLVEDKDAQSYDLSYKFDDFLEQVYSNITYDPERQMFLLEQIVDGKVKKGFVGASFHWNIYYKGSLCYGAPCFEKAVEVPCEYDEIIFIDDKYAKVCKDGKWGLIKFEYNLSCGDYDEYNRKRNHGGFKQELSECEFNEIETLKKSNAHDAFIGIKEGEIGVITDAFDYETKRNITIFNNYKKIKLLSSNVFLCELPNRSKEVVVLSEQYTMAYWDWAEKKTIKNVISPTCDDARIVQPYDSNLIEVMRSESNHINRTIYNVYQGEVKVLEKDVHSIKYDEASSSLQIIKLNGHIKFTTTSGTVLFDTEQIGLNPTDLKVEYLTGFGLFKVVNNGVYALYQRQDKASPIHVFDDRLFNYVDVAFINRKRFVGYTTTDADGKQETKLVSLKEVNGKFVEQTLLTGEYQVEDIVESGDRIIISKLDSNTGKKLFGVIESEEGNVCIDCEWDDIEYTKDQGARTNLFTCYKGDLIHYYDVDGFDYGKPSFNTSIGKTVSLQLSPKNNEDKKSN